MIALLDVNFLLALFVRRHIFHQIAHDWFEDHREAGWATCPLTENGAIRLLSLPQNNRHQEPLATLVERIAKFRASGHHHFWTDEISLTDPDFFRRNAIRGRKQLTDLYLLGLAQKRNGRLVTLDRRISPAAVVGLRPGTLHVVEPAD